MRQTGVPRTRNAEPLNSYLTLGVAACFAMLVVLAIGAVLLLRRRQNRRSGTGIHQRGNHATMNHPGIGVAHQKGRPWNRQDRLPRPDIVNPHPQGARMGQRIKELLGRLATRQRVLPAKRGHVVAMIRPGHARIPFVLSCTRWCTACDSGLSITMEWGKNFMGGDNIRLPHAITACIFPAGSAR